MGRYDYEVKTIRILSLFEKIDVKGHTTHPLFQYLSDEAPGILGLKAVKWQASNKLKACHSFDCRSIRM